MKHFPDSSLQHLVTVPGDFGVANPSFWSRPLLKRHLKSSTGLSVKTQAPTIFATHRPFSRDNQLFHLQVNQ